MATRLESLCDFRNHLNLGSVHLAVEIRIRRQAHQANIRAFRSRLRYRSRISDSETCRDCGKRAMTSLDFSSTSIRSPS